MKKWLLILSLIIVGCQKEYIEYIEVIEECECECESFPSSGLVAYYPFNGNTNDESGNENHPVTDTSILSTDRRGDDNSSVMFSGETYTNYIQLDIDTSPIDVSSEYTLGLWVYKEGNGSSNPRVLEFWGNDGPGQLGITWENDDDVTIGNILENGEVEIFVLPLSPQTWHYITYSVSSKEIKAYIDGNLIESRNINSSPSLIGDVSLGMMNHPGWDSFNGKIDDVALWDRVLSIDEIRYISEEF